MPQGASVGPQVEASFGTTIELPQGDFLGEDAIVTGTIQIMADRPGCVVLRTGTERAATLWPPGYRLSVAARTIFAPDGEVLARDGDELTAGGGNYEDAEDSPCGETTSVVASLREPITAG